MRHGRTLPRIVEPVTVFVLAGPRKQGFEVPVEPGPEVSITVREESDLPRSSPSIPRKWGTHRSCISTSIVNFVVTLLATALTVPSQYGLGLRCFGCPSVQAISPNFSRFSSSHRTPRSRPTLSGARSRFPQRDL